MGVAVVYVDRQTDTHTHTHRQQFDAAFCMCLEMVISSFRSYKRDKEIPRQAHRFSGG